MSDVASSHTNSPWWAAFRLMRPRLVAGGSAPHQSDAAPLTVTVCAPAGIGTSEPSASINAGANHLIPGGFNMK
jgi:hypothetical protein